MRPETLELRLHDKKFNNKREIALTSLKYNLKMQPAEQNQMRLNLEVDRVGGIAATITKINQLMVEIVQLTHSLPEHLRCDFAVTIAAIRTHIEHHSVASAVGIAALEDEVKTLVTTPAKRSPYKKKALQSKIAVRRISGE